MTTLYRDVCSCTTRNEDFKLLLRLRELDSPLRRRQNPTLSATETRDLRHIISTSDTEYQRYDNEIARLRGLIVFLENEKTEFQRRVHSATSLLAPVRRLPVDVVGTILTLAAVPSPETSKQLFSPGPASVFLGPFSVGHICSQWRSIALETPAVWSQILVSFVDRDDSLGDKVLDDDPLDALLSRSQNHPLTINLSARGEDGLRTHAPILAKLMEHSRRWGDVTITSTRDSISVLNVVRGKLDSLRSLELQLSHPLVQANVALDPVLAFLDAPMLSNLTIRGVAFTMISTQSNHLRTLFLCNHYVQSCLEALSTSPHLIRATLAIAKSVGQVPSCTSQVQELRLKFRDREDRGDQRSLASFLSALTAPCLTSLSIETYKHNRAFWDSTPITDMIKRSSPPLTSLHLHIPFARSELIALLHLVPRLIALSIDDDFPEVPQTVVTEEFMHAMNVRQAGVALVPVLEKLKLTMYGRNHIEESLAQALVSMVQSRYVPPQRATVKAAGSIRIVTILGIQPESEFAKVIGRRLKPLGGLTIALS